MRVATIALILFAMVAGCFIPAAAQEAPESYLPTPESLGPDWVAVEVADFEVNTEAFRDGIVALYGGPAGARVKILALRLTDPTKARRSWELATETYEEFAHQHADGWYWNDGDLVGIPAPAGCNDIKRAQGPDGYFTRNTGVTLCAHDPDIILIVVASGVINGTAGYSAADLVLNAAFSPAGTPTP